MTTDWLEDVEAVPKSNSVSLLDEFASVHAEHAKLSKKLETLKSQVKELGVGEHRASKCLVIVRENPSVSFQSKALKEDHPELHAKYEKKGKTVQVSIGVLP